MCRKPSVRGRDFGLLGGTPRQVAVIFAKLARFKRFFWGGLYHGNQKIVTVSNLGEKALLLWKSRQRKLETQSSNVELRTASWDHADFKNKLGVTFSVIGRIVLEQFVLLLDLQPGCAIRSWICS